MRTTARVVKSEATRSCGVVFWARLLLLLGPFGLPVPLQVAAQQAPGFLVSTYAVNVPDPVNLSFAPDSTLYLGRDTPPGGSTPEKITRVAWLGSPVTQYGSTTISDPDYVAFDSAGAVSGVPGAVLVGGALTGSLGRISGIRPDQSIFTVFESSAFANPTDMRFDRSGRLLFGDQPTRRVFATAGSSPVPLFTLPTSYGYPVSLAIDPTDRIFVSTSTGKIVLYDYLGGLIDSAYASFPSPATIDLAPEGPFQGLLYARLASSGEIYKIAGHGSAALFGTGFTGGGALRFGPRGLMYISAYANDQVLQVAPDLITGVGARFPGPQEISVMPNPTRGAVLVSYATQQSGDVAVEVYDVSGRRIVRLMQQTHSTGSGAIAWDGRGPDGRSVPPGVYQLRVTAPGISRTHGLVVVK